MQLLTGVRGTLPRGVTATQRNMAIDYFQRMIHVMTMSTLPKLPLTQDIQMEINTTTNPQRLQDAQDVHNSAVRIHGISKDSKSNHKIMHERMLEVNQRVSQHVSCTR